MIRINLLKNDFKQNEPFQSNKNILEEQKIESPKNHKKLVYALYAKSALLLFGLMFCTNSFFTKSNAIEISNKKPGFSSKITETKPNLEELKTKLEFLKEFYTNNVDSLNNSNKINLWLSRLDSFAIQNDFNSINMLNYIEKSQDRLYLYYNYIESFREKNLRYKSPLGSKQDVFEVILSSLAAEYFYGIDAELGIAIAMSETQIRFIKGFNGNGYFQLTMNSSLSDLNGLVQDDYYNNRVLNLVNEHSKNKILVPRSAKQAFKYGFDNCMAAYETLLLKTILFKINSDLPLVFAEGQITADHILENRKNRLGVLLNYNGHDDHKEVYSKNTNKTYEDFISLRTKLGYVKAPGLGLITLQTHY